MYTSAPSNGLKAGQFRFDYVGSSLGVGGLGRVDPIQITESNAVGMPVGSRWACKRLNEKWNLNPTMRERFEREIAALEKMSHENIVTCHGQNLPGGERFYLMPIYSSTLRKWIASRQKLGDWRFVASLGVSLAVALAYAHDLRFIHRDLKPDNILFNDKGPLVIADWGLGYFVHQNSIVLQQLTRGGMGTEYYCSLEQWTTGKCDQRGDIYSLGMTLDECVTGQQRTISVGAGITTSSTAMTGRGAKRFNDLIISMTQRMPERRPRTMEGVASELRAALAENN